MSVRKIIVRLTALLLVPCLLVDPSAAALARPDVWRAASASVQRFQFESQAFASRVLGFLPDWARFLTAGRNRLLAAGPTEMFATRSTSQTVYRDAVLAQALADDADMTGGGWVTGGGKKSKYIHPTQRLGKWLASESGNRATRTVTINGLSYEIVLERFGKSWEVAWIRQGKRLEKYRNGVFQTAEEQTKEIISVHPELAYHRPLLEELFRVFGSLEGLRGLRGIELGPLPRPELLQFLLARGVNISGVGMDPVGGTTLPYVEVRDYDDYFETVVPGSVDFILARLSLHLFIQPKDDEPQIVQSRADPKRNSIIRKRYVPLVKALSTNGLLVAGHRLDDDIVERNTLTKREIDQLGMRELRANASATNSLFIQTLQKGLDFSVSERRPVSRHGSVAMGAILLLLAAAVGISGMNFGELSAGWTAIALAVLSAGYLLQAIVIANLTRFVWWLRGLATHGLEYELIRPFRKMQLSDEEPFLSIDVPSRGQIINANLVEGFEGLPGWLQWLVYLPTIGLMRALHELPGHLSPMRLLSAELNEMVTYALVETAIPLGALVGYAFMGNSEGAWQGAFIGAGFLGFLSLYGWIVEKWASQRPWPPPRPELAPDSIKNFDEAVAKKYADPDAHPSGIPVHLMDIRNRPVGQIKDGDVVFNLNTRLDRPQQLTAALIGEVYAFFKWLTWAPLVYEVEVAQHWINRLLVLGSEHWAWLAGRRINWVVDEFPYFWRPPVRPHFYSASLYLARLKHRFQGWTLKETTIKDNLTSVLSKLLPRQEKEISIINVAFVPKKAHVTYYSRGFIEESAPGELSIILPDLGSPEANAEIFVKTLNAISQNDTYQVEYGKEKGKLYTLAKDRFIRANWAWGDEYGHISYDKAKQALQAIDKQFQLRDNRQPEDKPTLLETFSDNNFPVLFAADHGSAELMSKDGKTVKSHSSNKVKLFYVDKRNKDMDLFRQSEDIGLANVTRTVTEMLGFDNDSRVRNMWYQKLIGLLGFAVGDRVPKRWVPSLFAKSIAKPQDAGLPRRGVLLIMDGCGDNPEGEKVRDQGIDAVQDGATNYNELYKTHPHTLAVASGPPVGQRLINPRTGELYTGNSETGHHTMAVGEPLEGLQKKFDHFAMGEPGDPDFIFKEDTPGLSQALADATRHRVNFHLKGQTSEGEVHSSMEHYYAIFRLIKKIGFKGNVYVHATSDGEDTPIGETPSNYGDVQTVINETGIYSWIASDTLREEDFNKKEQYDRTEIAYRANVEHKEDPLTLEQLRIHVGILMDPKAPEAERIEAVKALQRTMLRIHQPDALVVDIAGVLLEGSHREGLRNFLVGRWDNVDRSEDLHVSKEDLDQLVTSIFKSERMRRRMQINGQWVAMASYNALKVGEATEEEFLNYVFYEFRRVFGSRFDQLERGIGEKALKSMFLDDYNSAYKANFNNIKTVLELHARGIPVIGLTNKYASKWWNIQMKFPIFGKVIPTITSFEAGASKPNRRMFEAAIRYLKDIKRVGRKHSVLPPWERKINTSRILYFDNDQSNRLAAHHYYGFYSVPLDTGKEALLRDNPVVQEILDQQKLNAMIEILKPYARPENQSSLGEACRDALVDLMQMRTTSVASTANPNSDSPLLWLWNILPAVGLGALWAGAQVYFNHVAPGQAWGNFGMGVLAGVALHEGIWHYVLGWIVWGYEHLRYRRTRADARRMKPRFKRSNDAILVNTWIETPWMRIAVRAAGLSAFLALLLPAFKLFGLSVQPHDLLFLVPILVMNILSLVPLRHLTRLTPWFRQRFDIPPSDGDRIWDELGPLLRRQNIDPAVTALTPVGEGLQVDAPATRREMKYLAAVMGVTAILSAGVTAEVTDMTPEQHDQTIEVQTREAKANGQTSYVNVTGKNLWETLNRANLAKGARADAIVIALNAVAFNDGMARMIINELQIVGLPIVLYNNSRIHMENRGDITADLVRELWESGKIIAIKDSSGKLDVLDGYIATGIPTYVGDERLIDQAMARGARGAVGSSSSLLPIINQMVQEKDPIRRRLLQEEFLRYRDALTVSGNKIPGGMKYALSRVKVEGIPMMRPDVINPKNILSDSEKLAIDAIGNRTLQLQLHLIETLQSTPGYYAEQHDGTIHVSLTVHEANPPASIPGLVALAGRANVLIAKPTKSGRSVTYHFYFDQPQFGSKFPDAPYRAWDKKSFWNAVGNGIAWTLVLFVLGGWPAAFYSAMIFGLGQVLPMHRAGLHGIVATPTQKTDSRLGPLQRVWFDRYHELLHAGVRRVVYNMAVLSTLLISVAAADYLSAFLPSPGVYITFLVDPVAALITLIGAWVAAGASLRERLVSPWLSRIVKTIAALLVLYEGAMLIFGIFTVMYTNSALGLNLIVFPAVSILAVLIGWSAVNDFRYSRWIAEFFTGGTDLATFWPAWWKTRWLYRSFGKTGLRFFVLGFGTVRFGKAWPRKAVPGSAPKPALNSTEIETFMKRVRNVLAGPWGRFMVDTAPAYGRSEEELGRFLNGNPNFRRRAFIATKWGLTFNPEGRSIENHSKANLVRSVTNSLSHLGRIDLLYIHHANAAVFKDQEVLDEMKRMKRKGDIRFTGASFSEEEEFVKAMREDLLADFDVIQMHVKIFDRQPELVQELHRRGIAIVLNTVVTPANRPMAGAEFQRLARHPLQPMILTGAPEYFDQNVSSVIESIPARRAVLSTLWSALGKVLRTYRSTPQDVWARLHQGPTERSEQGTLYHVNMRWHRAVRSGAFGAMLWAVLTWGAAASWADVFIPKDIVLNKVPRPTILYDFDGVMRPSEREKVDPRVAENTLRLEETGRVTQTVMSGSAVKTKPASRSWKQDNPGIFDALQEAFGTDVAFPPGLTLIGVRGQQGYKLESGEVIALKKPLNRAEAIEGLRLLLETFLEIVVDQSSNVRIQDKAHRLLHELENLLVSGDRDTETYPAETPDEFEPIVNAIMNGPDPIAPFFHLVYKDGEVYAEIAEDSPFDLSAAKERLAAKNTSLRTHFLSARPPQDIYAFSHNHWMNFSVSAKDPAADSYLANRPKPILADDEQELIIGIEDSLSGLGMLRKVQLGIYDGKASDLKGSGLHHVMVVRDPSGRDNVLVDGTAQFQANLLEAVRERRPFSDVRYFQAQDAAGLWRWYSIDEILREGGDSSLDRLIERQGRRALLRGFIRLLRAIEWHLRFAIHEPAWLKNQPGKEIVREGLLNGDIQRKELEELKSGFRQVLLEVGQELRVRHEEMLRVAVNKSDGSPITKGDLYAQVKILRFLLRQASPFKIVARSRFIFEENIDTPDVLDDELRRDLEGLAQAVRVHNAANAASDYVVSVDPIDGTVSFANFGKLQQDINTPNEDWMCGAALYYRKTPILVMGYAPELHIEGAPVLPAGGIFVEASIFDTATHLNGQPVRVAAIEALNQESIALLTYQREDGSVAGWPGQWPDWRTELAPVINPELVEARRFNSWVGLARVAASGTYPYPVLFSYTAHKSIDTVAAYWVVKAGGAAKTIDGKDLFPVPAEALVDSTFRVNSNISGATRAVGQWNDAVREMQNRKIRSDVRELIRALEQTKEILKPFLMSGPPGISTLDAAMSSLSLFLTGRPSNPELIWIAIEYVSIVLDKTLYSDVLNQLSPVLRRLQTIYRAA